MKDKPINILIIKAVITATAITSVIMITSSSNGLHCNMSVTKN